MALPWVFGFAVRGQGYHAPSLLNSEIAARAVHKPNTHEPDDLNKTREYVFVRIDFEVAGNP